jgi:NAD(P)-dependent dehydrogenase (short-subunit alcohol dehydrogenase family)
MHPFSLHGKCALVAGASRGIGQAIAEHLARAGAKTLLASRSVSALTSIAKGLQDEGCEAEALELDIASRDSIRKAAESAGEVDILVNVAGTNIRKRFEDYTPEEYSFLLNTNLTGIVELTQHIGRGMISRKRGKVINIGSLTSISGLPYVTIYALTKSAMAGWTRALAAEWGRHGIQVNCIAPGFVLTDLNRAMWQPPEMMQWLKGAQALPRMGSPEDIAPLAVFLSSAGSDFITGQVIAADGGCSTTEVWPFEPAPK